MAALNKRAADYDSKRRLEQMTRTEQIALDSYNAGNGKLSQYGFQKAGGSFGDYYYRVYVRAFNKLVKDADNARKAAAAAITGGLVERLFAATADLRAEYLTRVEQWAEQEFDRIAEFASTPARLRETFTSYKDYASYQNRKQAARNVVNTGRAIWIVGEVKNAVAHYENSIHKLAARIEKKGLDQSNLTIKSGRVGVNFETTLTDGTQTVRAWTIVASGPVQRPHYRYLVK